MCYGVRRVWSSVLFISLWLHSGNSAGVFHWSSGVQSGGASPEETHHQQSHILTCSSPFGMKWSPSHFVCIIRGSPLPYWCVARDFPERKPLQNAANTSTDSFVPDRMEKMLERAIFKINFKYQQFPRNWHWHIVRLKRIGALSLVTRVGVRLTGWTGYWVSPTSLWQWV